jgi:hypothetical protein
VIKAEYKIETDVKMARSVKNKLINKNKIDQLDDNDSMIDDFLDESVFVNINGKTLLDKEYDCLDDNNSEYSDYLTEISSLTNEPIKNIENTSIISSYVSFDISNNISHEELMLKKYKEINNYDEYNDYDDVPNNIYTNFWYFISFFDFTKYIIK